MRNNKHIKKGYEDFILNEQNAPTKKPATTPTKVPDKTPTRRSPSPIRRDKPSVKPKPMAITADDIYDRFIEELRAKDGEIEFDLKFLAKKYKITESCVVKGFARYVYEASLEGNPGIPGEGEGDDAPSHLRNIETRGRQMQRDTQTRYGARINQFMSLVQEVKRLQAGKEREMEQLAEDAIREMYGSILDGVKLDIKFPEEEEMKDEMEEVEMEAPEMEEIEDEETIREIHKRKITNNITQGEAKNTKLILNMPFIADGLKRILGDEDGAKMVSLLTDITNIASFFDWAIPIEAQKGMWASKDGFAGTVSVDWEESEDDKAQKTAEDILKDIESGGDILDNSDELEEMFKETTPVIKARGLDFAMLIHETVKGIYQLIASIGIPEDEGMANTVIMNTDNLAGELEDLRYGPYIASDIHEFIMSFPEANDVDNLKEHFYGKIIALPAAEFLELIRLILMEDNSARRMAQEYIDEIVQEIRDFEVDGIANTYDDDEYGEAEVDDRGAVSPSPLMGDETYAAMSNREIQTLIDDALDAGDMDEVRRLAGYLKESLLRNYELNNFKFIGSFSRFKKNNYELLIENVNSAKQYFIKDKAVKAGFDPENLTDDEKLRLSRHPDLVKVLNIVGSHAGYAVSFVKFKIDQNADIESLKTIMDLLQEDQVKSLLGELPMSVPEYAAVPFKEGEKPGYEMLMDDIAELKDTAAGRWIVKALVNQAGTKDYQGNQIPGAVPFNQKDAFKNADPEVRNRIIKLAAQLNTMDTSGKIVQAFKRKMGNKKSLDAIEMELQNKISAMGSKMSDTIEAIDSKFPGSNVVWEGKDRFIAIFRSPNALGELCKIANWCIRPTSYGGQGMFYSYVKEGNIQYVFYDYSLPVSHRNHMIGVTVKPDGSVRDAYDAKDANMAGSGYSVGTADPILGNNFDNYLDYFKVPADAKKEIKGAIQGEVDLIKDVTPFYKLIDSGSGDLGKVATDIIIRTEKRANTASFKGEDFQRDSTIDRLLATELSLSKNSDDARKAVLERFKEKGCSNPEAARYFKLLFEGSSMYTDEIIDKVIMGTKIRQEAFTKLLRSISNASASDKEKFTRKAKGKDLGQIKKDSQTMLDNISDSIAYLESLKKSN